MITSATVHENPYYSVLRQDVAVEDGTRRDYFTLHFPHPAVGIVARRGTDFLLVRQYRFIVDEYVWAIPSGGAAADESTTSAAARELEEETGYSAVRLTPFMTCYASYGCGDQRFEIFVAEDVTPLAAEIDGAEVLEVRWFTREEVMALVRDNGIVDNLSLSPILLALLQDVET